MDRVSAGLASVMDSCPLGTRLGHCSFIEDPLEYIFTCKIVWGTTAVSCRQMPSGGGI
jgi:hypothetical protein